jgi:GT2 family glycosyltransferase
MSSRTFTCIVPTYERRDDVRRLLEGLAGQLDDPAAAAGVDVLVVVDGSTDGTRELLEDLTFPVPLTTLWQENAGLSAARNRGLEAARGEVVWFLDDDMLVPEGTLARHRAAHDSGPERLVVGPCLPPPDRSIVPVIRRWADHQYAELARAGRVENALYFSAANTSGPRELWRRVGGFAEDLRGWGGEDYELGLRLLGEGVTVAYDHDAVVWHLQARTIAGFCSNTRDQGRNAVRIARLHPDAVDDLFPRASASRGLRAVRRLCGGSTAAYGAAAGILTLAAVAEERLTRGRRQGALRLARAANRLAGSVELDREGRFTTRLFDAPA